MNRWRTSWRSIVAKRLSCETGSPLPILTSSINCLQVAFAKLCYLSACLVCTRGLIIQTYFTGLLKASKVNVCEVLWALKDWSWRPSKCSWRGDDPLLLPSTSSRGGCLLTFYISHSSGLAFLLILYVGNSVVPLHQVELDPLLPLPRIKEIGTHT